MRSYFTSRRAAMGFIASFPIMANASSLFKNKVDNATSKNSLFIDFLLQNIPYSNSHSPIGLFVVQNTKISKIALNKLNELQESLQNAFLNQNPEQLNNDLEVLVKNDFLTFKTLTIQGLVISETEATIWALQYSNYHSS
jgi:hypothetical protein